MEYQWLRTSPSLNKGIDLINQLEEGKIEQFLKRIAVKVKNLDNEIFTEEERQKLIRIFKIDDVNLILVIKTSAYLLKQMFKYIFKPTYLKNYLITFNLNVEKADVFVKVWSVETRSLFDEFGSDNISNCCDNFNVMWKLNAELSSDYCKKVKIPKAYLSIINNNKNQELELTHPELYTMFIQFEAIQNELDNLM